MEITYQAEEKSIAVSAVPFGLHVNDMLNMPIWCVICDARNVILPAWSILLSARMRRNSLKVPCLLRWGSVRSIVAH
ncbi:hypothetical protein [Streptomyces sp. NPDC059649]|uniref:hypothetical protein n=1 Tax=Streptomyces sp. NPDC059649 TaxID=3346895 RepID=UPI0036CA4E3B